MPSASALRKQIELTLESRFPAALTPQPRTFRDTAPTGIPQIDALLNGGLPIGAISELTGPESSGRTSLALSFLAELTREPRVCAWVDASDAFDAESAAASGLSLRQLLWVRCQPRNVFNRTTSNRASTNGISALQLLAPQRPRVSRPACKPLIRPCAQPICSSRPEASPLLCSISPPRRLNTAIASPSPPGFVSARLPIAPAARSSFSLPGPLPSPAQLWFSSARQ